MSLMRYSEGIFTVTVFELMRLIIRLMYCLEVGRRYLAWMSKMMA